ncbi:MAG TPA: DinB family protein [Ktedonobacterales bacterium]|nr:DinB family protein [Ktedonobacterales bacterium]
MNANHQETIQQVGKALAEASTELGTWFARPEASRVYHPQDGGWSINEILEHVSLTSHYLLLIIRQGYKKALGRAARGETIPDGESDLHKLEPIGHPDAFPWLRPEHMEPTRKTSLAEVQARIHAQYQDCQKMLAGLSGGAGALYLVRMSVQDLGKMDMYQWLYFLALHQKRHIAQMERVYQEWAQTQPKP